MVRTNSKAQQYWLYFLKPYNYLIIRFIFFILGCVIKALVHTQPSIYSIATWHTYMYYNVYPLDLLIAR